MAVIPTTEPRVNPLASQRALKPALGHTTAPVYGVSSAAQKLCQTRSAQVNVRVNAQVNAKTTVRIDATTNVLVNTLTRAAAHKTARVVRVTRVARIARVTRATKIAKIIAHAMRPHG